MYKENTPNYVNCGIIKIDVVLAGGRETKWKVGRFKELVAA